VYAVAKPTAYTPKSSSSALSAAGPQVHVERSEWAGVRMDNHLAYRLCEAVAAGNDLFLGGFFSMLQ